MPRKPSAARAATAKPTAPAGRSGPKPAALPMGKEAVLIALRAANKSVHVMEIVQIMGAPKTAKGDVEGLLSELAEVGWVKELPGQRYRLEKTINKDRVLRAKASRQMPSLEAQKDTDRTTVEPPVARAPGSNPNKQHGRPADERSAERERKAATEPPLRQATPRTGTRPKPLGSGSRGAEVSGWLSMTTRGFGFVTATTGEEIFVPPSNLGGALHGDEVRVSMSPSDKGFDGHVLGVTKRAWTTTYGSLVRRRGELMVEPGDPRLPPMVLIDLPLPLDTRPNDVVEVTITSYAQRDGELPRGRVLRSMPHFDSPIELEVLKIKARDGIEEPFSPEVKEDAAQFGVTVLPTEFHEDLTHLEFVTIDPETARDHDDAVFIEKQGDGYKVWVAIADVSHYVREGSALDAEARRRGCSIYLPDRAIPMLPFELSSNLASIVPNEKRLALVVEASVNKRGGVADLAFKEAVIMSRARLTYPGVAQALGLSTEAPKEQASIDRLPMLRMLDEVSSYLRAHREKRGALNFELPEPRIILGDDRKPIRIELSKGDLGVKRAYQIVEDLMLLANEAVARFFREKSIPLLSRVHGTPDAKKLAAFGEVADAFGLEFPGDAIADPTQSKLIAEFLEKLADNLLKQSEQPAPAATGDTESAVPTKAGLINALSYLLLRAMQQATYSATAAGHYALAAPDYTHFTSPIRRYPDLVVHRSLRKWLRKDRLPQIKDLLPIGVESSRLERRAMWAEREVQNIYRAVFMMDSIGSTFEGYVSGISSDAVFVTVQEPYVDIKIPRESLPGDVEADRLGISLVGRRSGFRLSLAQTLKVTLVEVSISRRELVGKLELGGARARGSRKLQKGRSTEAGRSSNQPRRR